MRHSLREASPDSNLCRERVYLPRVYLPRVYLPRVYLPRGQFLRRWD